MNNADGQVAFITGGASGIGRALAEELATQGVEVVLADRQADLAQQVASAIRQSGGRATACGLDVRDLDQFQRVVDETVARTGRIDYFFNNAGIGVGGDMANYEMRDWDDVIDVNIRGVVHGVHTVYPVMRAQGSGHMIHTASMAGLMPTPSAGSYTATKHAVVGLSKALRIEAKEYGVRVSALCPGVIRTPIMRAGKFGRTNLDPSGEEKMMEFWGNAPADGPARVRTQSATSGGARRPDHHRPRLVEAHVVARTAIAEAYLMVLAETVRSNARRTCATPPE